jgi:hypothetical protein
MRCLLRIVFLLLLATGPLGGKVVQLFPFTNVWRFDQSGADLSGQFQDPLFNDASWPPGPGLLYAETASLPQPRNTPLTLGRVTYYFRTHFNFPTNGTGVTLISSNLIDDGAVIYLDGAEMSRIRMPDSPAIISNMTLAGVVDNAVTYDVVVWTDLSIASGDHVLAVEVHQQSAGSSDVVFGMSLTAIIPTPPTLTDASEPRDRVVLQHQGTVLSVYASATPPVSYQWFFREGTSAGMFDPIADATNSTYTIADMTLLQAGRYFAVVSNPLGEAVSRTAVVSYSEDREPPVLLRAVGSAGFDQVVVEFNEVVHPEAEELSHYRVASGGNSLQLFHAALSPDGRSVILTTAPQTEDTLYQVTVNDVSDATGQNIIAPNSTAQFRSWTTTGHGGLLFETYATGGGGTAVFILTNHPSFPNNPTERMRLTRFDTREVYPDDSHDAYGGRIRGLFLPPVSGEWKFYLRSDDSSELWMNTNGPSPAGRTLIAEETSWGSPFVEDTVPGRLTSRPLRLMAGQPYYIEALYNEWGANDYCQVAAGLADDPTPAGDLVPISGDLLGVSAAPPGVAGQAMILQSPSSRTNVENTIASVRVSASNAFAAPIWYQWRRNGIDIAGANAAEYSFQATLADDGARFSCLVSVVGHSASSAEAVLTVRPDIVSPACLGGRGTRSLTTLILAFSEFMRREPADDRFNYRVADSVPAAATLDATGTNVWLTLDQKLPPGAITEVSIYNLTDLAGNRITPEPFVIHVPMPVLTCGYAALELYFGLPGTSLGALRDAPKFPLSPDRLSYVSLVEGPIKSFDDYGARISGWLLPPVSGVYHFWMSSERSGEFWLSTDEDEANLRVIAHEPEWNGSRDWLGLTRRNAQAPENRSSTLFPEGIALEAGHRYYFEGLMKASFGGDNLAVTWQIPGGPAPVLGSEPISGTFLATLADPVADSAFVSGGRLEVSRDGQQLSLSWACPGFRLQRNSDPGGHSAWSDVAGGDVSPVAIAVQNASQAFFRLIR